MLTHAKLSASSSERWLNCTASVGAIKQLLDMSGKPNVRTSSPAAMEGTCAHELGEICLKTNDSPYDYIGKFLKDEPTIIVTSEMARHVEDYVNYVQSFETKTSELMVEKQVSYSEYATEGFGTSDVIILDGTTCHVIDLKYGQGIKVDVENNSQLMLYALGVYQDFDFTGHIETFELHIFQPRVNNISRWAISVDDLLTFSKRVKTASNNIATNNVEFKPSKKACQWCEYQGHCKATQRHIEKEIGIFFDDLTLPAVETIDYKMILDVKPIVESWLKAVEEVAFKKLSDGENVPGYKLVEGRSSRKWDDVNLVSKMLEKHLNEKAYSKRLLTPPQAEKICTKEQFAEYTQHVCKTNGKPTLAKESDKRESIINFDDFFKKL